MNPIAAPHVSVKAPLVLLVATAIFLIAMVGTAGAAPPIGKDGKIHACYRVKGKPKGSLRVVPGQRCKRGERKVTWSVAGTSSQAGANGQAGAGGQQGQSGSTATSSSNEAALKTEIAGLELKVAGLEGLLQGIDKGDLSGLLGRVNGLEGVLDGVTNSDLTGMLDTLDGVTNTELLDTVASLPALDLVCEQNEKLAEQVNLLRGVVGGLGLAPALEIIGLLEIPALPTALDLNQFGCPAP